VTGPVAEFCAGLSELQRASGLNRAKLAQRLGYSKSQLYAILDGQIARPPDWGRLVEPLVRACTGNSERTVADWRRRYEVLVGVYEAMERQRRQTTPARAEPAQAEPATSLTGQLPRDGPVAVPVDVTADARPERRPPAADKHRPSDRQRLAIGLTISGCGLGLLALGLGYGGANRPAGWIPGLALAVIGLVIPRWTTRTASPILDSVEHHLDSFIERLADTIARQESADLPRSRFDQRLRLQWSAAPGAVMDDLSNIRACGRGRPLREKSGLDGHWESMVEYVQRLPRLVFLGGSGSGKTVLTHYLTREWLKARKPGEPVPVVLALASWDPSGQGPYEWISLELSRSRKVFRTATATSVGEALHDLDDVGSKTEKLPAGARVAYELLDRHRILPVLDGLDEIPEPLRPIAISRLNEELPETGRLLLTSRPDEYRQAVTGPMRDALGELAGTVLEGAAVVTLQVPAATEIDRYLTSGEPGQKWAKLVADLTENPGGELAKALFTPLMVWLTRTIYARRPCGPDGTTADSLVDMARTGGAGDVKRHLLEQFIPAVYAGTRWSPKAADWLAFLARHLEDSERRRDGISWWLLWRAAKRPVEIIVGLAMGLLITLAIAPGMSHLVDWVPGTLSSLAIGGIFGVLCSRSELPPTDVKIQVRTRFRAALRGGLVVAALAGSTVGGATHSLRLGVIGGLTFGVLLAFAYMHTTNVDTERAVSPLSLLERDRAAVGAYVLVYGISTGFTGWLVYGPMFGLLFGSAAGLAGGLIKGVQYGFSFGFDKIGAAAWGRFQMTRAWLAATGRLPWQLMTFLADARQRGVLRQEGGAYYFRHAELREQLARPRARD